MFMTGFPSHRFAAPAGAVRRRARSAAMRRVRSTT
jgi:hypothetical protein